MSKGTRNQQAGASSQEPAGSRQCLEGGPAGTNGSGAPGSGFLETDRGSTEPLLVHNLLTNLPTLESLLMSELGREDWLNASSSPQA